MNGHIDTKVLASMARGATISGIRYGPVRIVVESNEGENHWLLVTICQGKNREVRNIMSHLGPKVSRLNRVEYGPFSLGRPPPAGQRSKSKINRAEGVVSIYLPSRSYTSACSNASCSVGGADGRRLAGHPYVRSRPVRGILAGDVVLAALGNARSIGVPSLRASVPGWRSWEHRPGPSTPWVAPSGHVRRPALFLATDLNQSRNC